MYDSCSWSKGRITYQQTERYNSAVDGHIKVVDLVALQDQRNRRGTKRPRLVMCVFKILILVKRFLTLTLVCYSSTT